MMGWMPADRHRRRANIETPPVPDALVSSSSNLDDMYIYLGVGRLNVSAPS
jgi:hypothetical protein